MKNDIKSTMIDKQTIAHRIREIGQIITKDYQGKDLLMVCVLRGSVLFFADLIREIDLPIQIDFIAISSYGNSTSSSGEVRMIKDLSTSIEGRNVIIVEDIIDSGTTIKFLKDVFNNRKPNSIKICSLLDKPSRRKADIEADYLGFTIENEFAVGYGLDYAEKYRNLPEVCILKNEIYEEIND